LSSVLLTVDTIAAFCPSFDLYSYIHCLRSKAERRTLNRSCYEFRLPLPTVANDTVNSINSLVFIIMILKYI